VKKPVVAVFNTNQDLVETLVELLEEEGYQGVHGHVTDFERGKQDLLGFLKKHDPQVIIFDVPPPYKEHWTFLQLVMSSHEMDGRALVVTTTSKKHLEEAAGKTDAIEVVGKPFDMKKILEAVKHAVAHPKKRAS
jgi:FixJ family two-component response regulator